MKKLHKKVSAVVLASMMLFGGIGLSGSSSFAASNYGMSDRMFIARYPKEFIGDSKQFVELYNELMENVSQSELNGYKRVIKKIKEEVKKLKVEYYFNLKYVGLPASVEKGIKKAGYNPPELLKGPVSPRQIVDFLYKNRQYHWKNYLVSIRYGHKVYRFILYVESK